MLIVSRPDVEADHIQHFPVEDRFLKLPVENYLDLLGIEPIRPQTALINAINNPKYRFVTACLSRRTGKTYIANILAQLVALVPGCNILLMSPNYSLTTISWELQRSLINKFDLEVEKNNQKDKVIVLSNGSSVRMGSVTQADSVVGRSYDLILFDEAALSDEGRDAFNIQLRPTLDKVNSKAIFISTPRGIHNYFHEFYQRGFSEDPNYDDWVSIHSDWRENPRASERDILQAKGSMSNAEFRQEYMADFTSFEGRIWNIDLEKCVKDLSELDYRRMDIIAGIDIGFKDPTAFCVIAYDPDDEVYYVLDDFLDNEKTTSEQADVIKELEMKYDIDMIFVDSAAAQTRHDWAMEHDISTISAKKSLLDGIAHVAGIIDNDKLIVDENCTDVLFALDQYQWDNRSTLTKEKPIHGEASHMADALRYALYALYTYVS
jgi:hypothetical protein